MPEGLRSVRALDLPNAGSARFGDRGNRCLNVLRKVDKSSPLAGRVDFETQMVVTYHSKNECPSGPKSLTLKSAGLDRDDALHLEVEFSGPSIEMEAFMPRTAAFAVPKRDGAIVLHLPRNNSELDLADLGS